MLVAVPPQCVTREGWLIDVSLLRSWWEEIHGARQLNVQRIAPGDSSVRRLSGYIVTNTSLVKMLSFACPARAGVSPSIVCAHSGGPLSSIILRGSSRLPCRLLGPMMSCAVRALSGGVCIGRAGGATEPRLVSSGVRGTSFGAGDSGYLITGAAGCRMR